MMEKRFLSTKEVSEIYGFASGSLANYRCNGTGPTYFKRNRKVLYEAKAIEDWIRANPILPTDLKNDRTKGL